MIVYCKHITHARMHERSHRLTLANTHTPTHVSVRPTMTDQSWLGALLFDAGKTMPDRRLIEINNVRGRHSIHESQVSFSRIKKLLGRIETRTLDRMYLGRMRSVGDISRDDRARIATCSLRTPTYRLMENYSRPYRLSVMIIIAIFCNFMNICVLKPHSKMLLLKCGAISELYMILRVYFGSIPAGLHDIYHHVMFQENHEHSDSIYALI